MILEREREREREKAKRTKREQKERKKARPKKVKGKKKKKKRQADRLTYWDRNEFLMEKVINIKVSQRNKDVNINVKSEYYIDIYKCHVILIENKRSS